MSTTTTNDLTDLETKALLAVYEDDFGRERYEENSWGWDNGGMFWLDCYCDTLTRFAGIPAKSHGGVIGSLIKKGLMDSEGYIPSQDEHRANDACVVLTEQGMKLLKELKAAN